MSKEITIEYDGIKASWSHGKITIICPENDFSQKPVVMEFRDDKLSGLIEALRYIHMNGVL